MSEEIREGKPLTESERKGAKEREREREREKESSMSEEIRVNSVFYSLMMIK
jgi:hypothetical protein